MMEEKTNLPDIEAVEKPKQKGKKTVSDKVLASLERGRKARAAKLQKQAHAKQHAANLMREMRATLLTMKSVEAEKRMQPIKEQPVELEAVESAGEPQQERGYSRLIGSGGLVLRPH